MLICALFGTALWQSKAPLVAGFATALQNKSFTYPPASLVEEKPKPEFGVSFVSDSFHRHVHSATIAPLPDGGLIAAWFAGSREGAHDVNIRASKFDAENQTWGEEFKLISRGTTEYTLQRNIRKLGNPVLALAPDNRLWLFYVSVSLGGWAGSSINTMYSDNGGVDWSTPKRLVTSPFFNISTLVRNTPVFHQDGSIGLPIYHEFLGKFAEYLYLNPDGKIIGKFRISDGDHSLQPSVVAIDADSAVAFLRNAGMSHDKVMVSFTKDRGETWTELTPTDPWNPNSSLAAVGEGGAEGDILVALNNLRDGRYRLSLYHTDQTLRQWQSLKVLDESPAMTALVNIDLFREDIHNKFMSVSHEDDVTESRLNQLSQQAEGRACNSEGRCEFKYEYPTIIRTRDGYFHLVYSWNNTLIKHVFFNSAWLKERS